MILVEGEKIIAVGKNLNAESGQQLISESDFDWYHDVRRGGTIMDILKEEKLQDDICIGNTLKTIVVGEEEKQVIDKTKIRIIRGGTTIKKIKYSEFQPGDISEYKYKKDELFNNNGTCEAHTDDEIKINKMNVITNELYRQLDWIRNIITFTKQCIDDGDSWDDAPMTQAEVNEWKDFFKDLRKIVKDAKNTGKLRDNSDLSTISINDIYFGNIVVFPPLPELPNGDYNYNV